MIRNPLFFGEGSGPPRLRSVAEHDAHMPRGVGSVPSSSGASGSTTERCADALSPMLHREDDHHDDHQDEGHDARDSDRDPGDRLHVITIATAGVAGEGNTSGIWGQRGAGAVSAS